MKFKKEDLQNLALEDHDGKVFEVIQVDLIDTSRWSNIYEMIFKHKGNFFQTVYSSGATEQQDESPYEYDPDEIECTEVVPKKVTVIRYVNKD